MERFLVTLSLGPVQSLIGAARRTRDLWCGSWLLSEAARAAARVLHRRQPGCLIFPCPEDPDTGLEPRDKSGDAANVAKRPSRGSPCAGRLRRACPVRGGQIRRGVAVDGAREFGTGRDGKDGKARA